MAGSGGRVDDRCAERHRHAGEDGPCVEPAPRARFDRPTFCTCNVFKPCAPATE